jgi:hypothetical protein
MEALQRPQLDQPTLDSAPQELQNWACLEMDLPHWGQRSFKKAIRVMM